ncbi:polyphosphate polymerase domain-containing protein [bacterium]|nr:polyphosphate polymerase domain-containing protein [bacterium]
METFERKEYKYYVRIEHLDILRSRLLEYMTYDDYCKYPNEKHHYTVRSIYLDDRDMRFYYEKMDGVKIRKKVRIRTYNTAEDNFPAFLEIKRKFNDFIYKERVKTTLDQTPTLLNGGFPNLEGGNSNFLERSVLNKFVYLIKRRELTPKVLITYEREAFQGVDDQNVRVTFDMNVRSFLYPNMGQIFREQYLKPLTDSTFILEIKFTGRMPIWIRNIVREFKIRVEAISKYCNGIDVWEPAFSE